MSPEIFRQSIKLAKNARTEATWKGNIKSQWWSRGAVSFTANGYVESLWGAKQPRSRAGQG